MAFQLSLWHVAYMATTIFFYMGFINAYAANDIALEQKCWDYLGTVLCLASNEKVVEPHWYIPFFIMFS